MRRGEEGFGLLEVLVSMIIVAILGGSLFYFLSAQNKLSVMSTDMTKGLHFGKQVMDSLKVSDYDNIASGSDTLVERYVRSWTISTQTDAFGMPTGRMKINVTVYWPLEGEHSVNLVTLLSDDEYKETP